MSDPHRCAFCLTTEGKMSGTWSNGRTTICHDCIGRIIDVLYLTNRDWIEDRITKARREPSGGRRSEESYASDPQCSYCRKRSSEVKKLIVTAGENLDPPREIGICNECVELCMDICADKDVDWRDKQIERLKAMAESPEDSEKSD